MGTRSSTEQVIARIAKSAHGVATRAELLAADVTAKQIAHRVRSGALIPEYPGVYRVGHAAPSALSRYVAAVKAGGAGATLLGRPAGYLLRILKAASAPAPKVATRSDRRVEGLKTRRLQLDRRDVSEVRGIPCTTVPRTIVDLAAELDEEDLARVFHEAAVRYGTTPDHVEAVLKRRPRCPGAPKLRAVMYGETKVTLSVLEREFLDSLAREDLPLPDTNRRVGKYRVDCRWTEPRVTVELLSYRYHRSRHAWERDHDREREARGRGDEWRSFTYDDVLGDQSYMLGELRKLLHR